jgi:molybdate transport system substrate-binding protein
MKRFTRRGLGLLAPLLLAGPARSQTPPITVFAGAGLRDALQAQEQTWRAAGGAPLRFVFAASSALARQLEQGAEAELFLAADEEWMAYAERNATIAPGTRRLALTNQLVLILPATTPDAIAVSLQPGSATDLAGLLDRNGRWATGDPVHVPIGRYAEAALRSLGQWDALASRLAPGATVRESLVLVERGEAAFGIVYRSDALVSRGVRVAASFPEGTHHPVRFLFALTPRGVRDPRAVALLDHLVAPASAPVWERFGFTPIGAAP